MSQSSRNGRARKAANGKPKKPYAEFPLTPHNSGAWMKKIRGKVYYFGKWGRVVNGKLTRIEGEGWWQDALALYKAQADDLHSGRTPRALSADGLTVADLCNRFLNAKQLQLEADEIADRTFTEYQGTTDRLIAAFGKMRLVDDLAADDFEKLRASIAKVWGPVRLGNEIQRVRTVFKYGYDAVLLNHPLRFGPHFRKPAKHVMRKHRATNGSRMMDASEVRPILDSASSQLKAMILLGVNCALGNGDCGGLPLSAIDLDKAWIRFPRPKTGIERRCPLWPETVAALREAIANRPTPKDDADADLVFITKRRQRWVRGGRVPCDAVSVEFAKLLKRPQCPACGKLQEAGAESCDVCKWEPSEAQGWGKLHRKGVGFYALRHTFRTIADATRDIPAVRLIMGHADGSIDDVYREHIDDSRLVAVADHVRAWLFPPQTEVNGGAQ